MPIIDLDISIWDVILAALLYLGPPPLTTIFAGGLTGLVAHKASVRSCLILGLWLGVLGSVGGLVVLVLARSQGWYVVRADNDNWLMFMLPIIATGVLFAAVTAFLTWWQWRRDQFELSS